MREALPNCRAVAYDSVGFYPRPGIFVSPAPLGPNARQLLRLGRSRLRPSSYLMCPGRWQAGPKDTKDLLDL